MKVKILQDGMTKFTGFLGLTEFEDSLSVSDVTNRDAIRLSSIIDCVWEDGSRISKIIDFSKLEATPGRETVDPEDGQKDTPVSDLWTAILHDKEEKVEDIVTGYKVSAVKKAKGGYIAVTLEGTNLKEHQNGNGEKGHWIGFAVEAPKEGDVDGFKYVKGDGALGERQALEKAVHDGKDGVAFYIDHTSDGMGEVKFKLQWMKQEETVGDEIEYRLDTTKVKNYVAPINANVKVAVAPTKRYTRAELEAVADESGIQGLREIADPLGIKATSIRKLIDEIYSVAGK